MEYLHINDETYKAVTIDWQRGNVYLHYKEDKPSTEIHCSKIQKHTVTIFKANYTYYGFEHPDGEFTVLWRDASQWGNIDFKESIEHKLKNLRESEKINVMSEIPFIY